MFLTSDPSLNRNNCLSCDSFAVEKKAVSMCDIMSVAVSLVQTWNTFQNQRIDSSGTKRWT